MTIQNIPKRILCCITWRINIKANRTIGQLWLLADTALSTAQNLIAGTTIIHFCDGRVLSAFLALKRNSWFHRSLKVGFWRDKRKRSMNILLIMGFDKRQKTTFDNHDSFSDRWSKLIYFHYSICFSLNS